MLIDSVYELSLDDIKSVAGGVASVSTVGGGIIAVHDGSYSSVTWQGKDGTLYSINSYGEYTQTTPQHA